MKTNRVVITGLGIVSPLGNGRGSFWHAVSRGISGIKKILNFDTSEFQYNTGGEIIDFNARNYCKRKNIKYLDRITRFSIAASRLAFEDADFEVTEEKSHRAGVVMGTMYSGWESVATFMLEMETDKLKRTSPAIFPNTVPNSAVSQIAIEFKLRSLCTSLNSGFSAGTDAIGWGYHYLQQGIGDVILAGGGEELNRWIYGSFEQKDDVVTSYNRRDEICRPFDARRKGLVLGEGACMLVLETYEHAQKRGARIYGELIGYGSSNTAYAYEQYSPSGEAAAPALHNAFKDAGINAESVDYICAEGNGTPCGDRMEAQVINTIFKERATQIPVSSIKSMIGHTFGAAGAFNAATCCLAMKNKLVPPTINYEVKDPECNLDCVPNLAREVDVNCAIAQSFSPGGHNSTLVIRSL